MLEKEAIILIVLLITIIMFSINKILNIVMGINTKTLKDFKEKIKNLQERVQNAQIINDPRMMYQLQIESTRLMKDMMKKQLVPMCSRCIVFIGLLIILDNFVFFDYRSGLLPFPILFFGNGWAALYFLFAITFSLLLFGIKKIYRKYTGKPDLKSTILKHIMGEKNLDSSNERLESEDANSHNFSLTEEKLNEKNIDDEISKGGAINSWKDKIKKMED
ncbi:MAG: EMC3/TMCO1 family protein [Promethearchaeota archaeon]